MINERKEMMILLLYPYYLLVHSHNNKCKVKNTNLKSKVTVFLGQIFFMNVTVIMRQRA